MKPLAIIVADDVPEIQDLIALWLRARGHAVTCSSSGDATLKQIASGHFDLVIADVLMPEGDGLEVIRELRQTNSTARVLAISGGGRYVPAADCVKLAERLGADAALLKPFDERQLLSGIAKAMTAPSRRRDG